MTRKSKDSIDNERFRSNLLSVISHELNTPLTSIINAVAMLEEKFPREQEYIPMLRRNAERLRKTVENILEISRIDAGTLRVRLSEFNLENFLLVRKEALKPQLEKSRFEMEYEGEEDLPHVCGDIRRLAHVFDALVLNAVKFSHVSTLEAGKTAKIHVKLAMEQSDFLPAALREGKQKKTGTYLVVSVQSSLASVGESPEDFEHLFEPFSPWRDADTRVKEGLGAELAIAKEILIAHEGFIWAHMPKQKKGGWIFYIALPLLSRLDELNLVINNRLFTSIGSLSKMSLFMLKPEPGYRTGHEDQATISKILKKVLFRSSDSTFWIQDTGEFVILMDDCDHEGAERVAKRLITALHDELPALRFMWSVSTGPEEGSNAQELLDHAHTSWRPAL